MSLAPQTLHAIREAVALHGGAKGAMLEALKIVQAEAGWVSEAQLAEAAAALGVTTAELESIASFYSHVFRRPVGETVILLCDGLSCCLREGEAVRDAVMARLGIGLGETTADGRFTLIEVCCIGGCDRAPAALVGPDRKLVGPLSAEDLSALIAPVP